MKGSDQTFFGRQFNDTPTWQQRTFDITVGIVLPIGCLGADLVLFRTGDSLLFPEGVLGHYSLLTYTSAAIQFPLLIVAVLGRRRSSILAGALLFGCVVALAIGLPLLPLSCVGLIVGIGALGFVPLLAAFSLFRNHRRVLSRATQGAVFGSVAGLLSAAVLPIGSHFAVQALTEAPIAAVASGSFSDADVEVLARWRFTLSLEPIVIGYTDLVYDPPAQQRISAAYRQITGRDIEQHVMIFLD